MSFFHWYFGWDSSWLCVTLPCMLIGSVSDFKTLDACGNTTQCLVQSKLEDGSAPLAGSPNETSKPSEVDSFKGKYVFEM